MSEFYEGALEVQSELSNIDARMVKIQHALEDFAEMRKTEPPSAAVMVYASLIQHFCFAQRGIQPTIQEMRAFAEVALNAAEALINVHFERAFVKGCAEKKEAGE